MSKVLIVDDTPTDRELLVTILKYLGHVVVEAGDAEKALSLAVQERPDLIITDILMLPVDGLEFCRRLHNHEELAQTPVIFYSCSYLDRPAFIRQFGDCGTIRKPAEPEQILQAVGQYLPVQDPVVCAWN